MQTLELDNIGMGDLLAQSITKLNYYQQVKLLEFVNAMIGKIEYRANNLLRFAGSIDKQDLNLMKTAIAEDCEKVDYNEW